MYSDCVPGGGGVLPYIGYIGVCGNKEYGFLAGLVLKKGYQFRPVWSGYVFFLERATSSSLGDKTISLWVLGQPSRFRNSTVLYPT